MGADDALHSLQLPDGAVTVPMPTTLLWGERDHALLPGLLDGLGHWVPRLQLQRVPEANVTYTENTMLKHVHSDIGVAVSIPGGLITPIVRKAETKGLAQISNEMKDYAARARARKLKPEEYQGGSSAVSNLGMFGIKNFSAVINPPHATILAVGVGEERVIVEKGQMKVATMMSVTMSTDHRAVDGALGAELITAFKDLIENPVGMLV